MYEKVPEFLLTHVQHEHAESSSVSHLKHKSETYILPVVCKVQQIDIGSYNT